MLFNGIIFIYYENHHKSITALHGQNSELLTVKLKLYCILYISVNKPQRLGSLGPGGGGERSNDNLRDNQISNNFFHRGTVN